MVDRLLLLLVLPSRPIALLFVINIPKLNIPKRHFVALAGRPTPTDRALVSKLLAPAIEQISLHSGVRAGLTAVNSRYGVQESDEDSCESYDDDTASMLVLRQRWICAGRPSVWADTWTALWGTTWADYKASI